VLVKTNGGPHRSIGGGLSHSCAGSCNEDEKSHSLKLQLLPVSRYRPTSDQRHRLL